ncbi:hypothetical protein [Persicobacter sp. CCB-QB2]|uniref:hypothetical protein n=1 Tax=Persicobacter sp. CCB-QB2 TaxID=1561025 RepID=UPI0006A9B76F|nr:hypothetical protein [Persicobacter sp. CCB-QB2]
MGVVIKQGVRASLITYFGVIFGALNFLYIMPKILEPDQIGMIRLLQDLAILLASFVQFSLRRFWIGLFRFLGKKECPLFGLR